MAAISEALVNAIVHREYGIAASTHVSMFDDKIEILPVRGLVPGISLDAVMDGVSVQRAAALKGYFANSR